MAKTLTNREKLMQQVERIFQPESTFIIFGLIYFPFAALFLDQGLLENVILAVYTLVMFIAAIFLISRFALFVANAANQHSDNYGSLLVMYMLDFAFPVLMLKAFSAVTMMMLPCCHCVDKTRLICEVSSFIRTMHATYDVQQILSSVFLVSLLVVGSLTLWAVGKRGK